MSTSHKPATAPTSAGGVSAPSSTAPEKSAAPRQQFVAAALTMSWQLALAVLVPVLGGVELGKQLGAQANWTLAGLAVALIASGLVMWHTLQAASRLPVPKLTPEERRAVRKSYEAEDDD